VSETPRPLFRFVAFVAVLVLTGVVLFPVYAVVVMSLSRAPGFSVVIAPDWTALTLDHFARVLGATDAEGRWLFGRQLLNSLVVSSAATAVGIILSTSAAYAFSRMRFPGHRAAMSFFLVTQMFPATMMVVPLYLLVSAMDLVDSVVGLVLVYATTSLPFCIWMLKGYFDTVPQDLDEAALIDGASRVRVFYQIILPLGRPAIAVTALFSFIGAWNEFILAATFLSRREAFTLPVTLYHHVGGHGADWGAFAAGSIVVSIPVCALFFYLQRNLVGGLSAGAVK
jgi:arabinogalactan oligomer/maltooligosaccharide transport system permease protein